MKNSRTLAFGLICLFLTAATFAQEKILKTVSLKFDEKSKETVLIKLDSFSPLKISSDKAEVILAQDEKGNRLEGVVLRLPQGFPIKLRNGYWFNAQTQCWIYGSFVYETTLGITLFYPAPPHVQEVMRVCAPLGQLYARP